MSEFLNIIKQRRSIRRYEDKKVPQEMLDTIIESVRWAQSWANTQCWNLVIIDDHSIKEQIQKSIFEKNPASRAVVDAPILLALSGKLKCSGYYNNQISTKFGDWFMFDLGIVTQNICLTAESLGLGTVVVGLFDHDKAKKVIGIPNDYELVTLIPLGFPAKKPSPTKRKNVDEFVHYNTFRN